MSQKIVYIDIDGTLFDKESSIKAINQLDNCMYRFKT